MTTVLAFGGGGNNDEQAAELKRLERSNAIVSPLLFAAGDIITAPGSHPITTIMRLPAGTDAARLHQAGVTAIGDDDDPAPIVARKKELGLDGVKFERSLRCLDEGRQQDVQDHAAQTIRVIAHHVQREPRAVGDNPEVDLLVAESDAQVLDISSG